MTFQTYYVMNEIFNFVELYINESELGKIGKIEFWAHWEFCACHKIFSVRKGSAGLTISKSRSVAS